MVSRSTVLLAVLAGACRAPEPPPLPPEPPPAANATPVGPPEVADGPASAGEPTPAPGPAMTIAEGDEPEPSDGGLVPVEVNLPKFERPSLPEPSEPIEPSRIKPGEYECKISRGYRFRPCTVAIDEHGRSILTVPKALMAIEGVLTDEGKVTHFDGIMTRERPFGCFSCQERCTIDPSSCYCKEMPPEHSQDCLMQPIRFKIRRKDGQWRGRIEHHLYYGDEDAEGKPVYETDHYVFVMRR